MAIITLTSDLGNSDHYVAALKGSILSLAPGATLIDVSHQITPFSIPEPAFILSGSYRYFPEGTIHLVAVDPDGGSRQKGIVMKYDGHYFVGPDNGIFSLIRRQNACEAVEISNPEIVHTGPRSFMSGHVYAPAAAWLAAGKPFEEIGEPVEMLTRYFGEPTYSGNTLRGTFIHIDHFGNAYTNISKEEFLRYRNGRAFTIFIRTVKLKRIVSTYSDVAKGDALALFGFNQYLEIALREGSASSMLGIQPQDMLSIEFTES